MTDVETLAERVRTVERAVTDGDHTFPAVDDIAELSERVEAVERRVEELDERTAELEGATQALRGYVGNIRSVNERVEQRADTALAATERLERRVDAGDTGPSETGPEPNTAPGDRNRRAEPDERSRRTAPDMPTAGETTPDRNRSGTSDISPDSDRSERSDPDGEYPNPSAGHGEYGATPTAVTDDPGVGLGGADSVAELGGADDADDSAEAGVLERMRSLL